MLVHENAETAAPAETKPEDTGQKDEAKPEGEQAAA
jgi:hypothetical protein